MVGIVSSSPCFKDNCINEIQMSVLAFQYIIGYGVKNVVVAIGEIPVQLFMETESKRIMGSVLLITFEVFVLHIVPDPLCTSIGSIVFKCEGKDTNLFSNIQIFNAEK